MTFYIGKEPTIGNYAKMDSITAVNGQATYNLLKGGTAFAPQSANHVICSLNSIIQNPGSSFTISGSQITFASNLQTGDSIDFILVLGDVLSIGTPSDDTIDSAKLKTNSVIEAKIQDDAVTKAKVNFISDSTAGVEVKGDGGSNDGYIALNCRSNSHAIKLKSPPHSAGQSYTLTFPSTAPATDKFLQTDSSGNLSFADAGGLVKKIETQLNNTRTTISNSGSKVTLFSGTYTNVQASSKVLIMMRIPVHGSRAGSLNTGFTWNGVDYDGAITNSYEDTDNLTFALMMRSFDSPASVGSIAWSVYFQSMSGSSTAPFGLFNPNSSDDSRMSQTSTQTTFLEYTT